jgi:hypothetical protein
LTRRPGPSPDQFKSRLIAAVEQALAESAFARNTRFQRVGAVASDLHDLGYTARIEASQSRARLKLIEGAQVLRLP